MRYLNILLLSVFIVLNFLCHVMGMVQVSTSTCTTSTFFLTTTLPDCTTCFSFTRTVFTVQQFQTTGTSFFSLTVTRSSTIGVTTSSSNPSLVIITTDLTCSSGTVFLRPGRPKITLTSTRGGFKGHPICPECIFSGSIYDAPTPCQGDNCGKENLLFLTQGGTVIALPTVNTTQLVIDGKTYNDVPIATDYQPIIVCDRKREDTTTVNACTTGSIPSYFVPSSVISSILNATPTTSSTSPSNGADSFTQSYYLPVHLILALGVLIGLI